MDITDPNEQLLATIAAYKADKGQAEMGKWQSEMGGHYHWKHRGKKKQWKKQHWHTWWDQGWQAQRPKEAPGSFVNAKLRFSGEVET